MKNIFKYKPEIDGLRALAVLPVIFFHAGIELFKGGYVGVDIFFVISGYLITTIILSEISKGKFNLKNFYLRRARRILPILYFICLLTIPFSIMIMDQENIKFFSKELISVILFCSNFFFWKNTGYFGADSDLQPLLHTWSLGVEEQFYIFFPIFVIIIWNLKKKYLVHSIIFILLLSILLSQFGGNLKYQNLTFTPPFFLLPFDFFWQAGLANFYLPFGRVWELMAGSLLAIYLSKNKIVDKKSNNIFSFLGFIAIVFSILYYSENIQYPSIFTLLPVVGTLLIIIFSTKKTVLNKILSYRPLVFIGLISYSLYLWHQPLLSFFRIYYNLSLNSLNIFLIILLSFGLSFLSWKYIETPFRNKQVITNKKLLFYLFTSSSLVIIFSCLILFEKIKPNQKILPKEILSSINLEKNEKCFDSNYAHIKKTNWYCKIGSPAKKISFVMFGDSHALALKPSFDKAAADLNKQGAFVGYSGCPPLLGVYSLRPDQQLKDCKKLNEKIFKYISSNKIKKIFLVARWSYYTDGNYDRTNFSHISKKDIFFSNKSNSREAFYFGLKETLEKYNNIGVEVIFVHQVPLQLYDPKYIYLKSLSKNDQVIDQKKLLNFAVDYEKHMSLQNFVRDKIKLFENEGYKFKVIDLNNTFCNKDKCLVGNVKNSYYYDKSHLSKKGAEMTKNLLLRYLD
ncbi:acyltransferase [Pelagibacteraceae bacterium]|nr:acyltransferase [Pelagibacteraceae bacterium]